MKRMKKTNSNEQIRKYIDLLLNSKFEIKKEKIFGVTCITNNVFDDIYNTFHSITQLLLHETEKLSKVTKNDIQIFKEKLIYLLNLNNEIYWLKRNDITIEEYVSNLNNIVKEIDFYFSN